jgi:deferrochelatase/peroxidase EfeB
MFPPRITGDYHFQISTRKLLILVCHQGMHIKTLRVGKWLRGRYLCKALGSVPSTTKQATTKHINIALHICSNDQNTKYKILTIPNWLARM